MARLETVEKHETILTSERKNIKNRYIEDEMLCNPCLIDIFLNN